MTETQVLLRRQATPRPNSYNAETRTFEAVYATDAPVQRYDYEERLNPAGADLSNMPLPLLDNHDRYSGVGAILGRMTATRREGSALVGTIQLSKRRAADVGSDIEDGTINSVSVGYRVLEWRETTNEKGKRVKTAVRWQPVEVSLVATPADQNAKVRNMENEDVETVERTEQEAPPPENRAAINRTIRELARGAGVDMAVADDLIERGASEAEANAEILNAVISRSSTPIRTAHNQRTHDNPENRVQAMGEALFARVDPAHTPGEESRQYVGQSIPGLAQICLRSAGVATTGLSNASIIERALHTTSDFPLILADTVGRTLRQSYAAAPAAVRQLARESSMPDFRSRNRLLLDNAGLTLEKVNEAGEFKSGTIKEAGEAYAIDSFGRIIGITRKALINDDIGAFSDLSRRMGQAAAYFEAQTLVDRLEANPNLSDGNPVFHASHKNLAGTGAAISETTLSAARLAMRKQTGLGSNLISVTPKYVLVPPDLETTAEKVLSQIQATKTSDVNPFTSLTLVVEPRLTSATAWYVVANKAEIDGLEYAYLAGAPGPQIETKAGFEVDGVMIKVRLDYGAGWLEYRGWYKNAGA